MKSKYDTFKFVNGQLYTLIDPEFVPKNNTLYLFDTNIFVIKWGVVSWVYAYVCPFSVNTLNF